MIAFHIERGGYVARADSTERRLMRGLASDVGTMLGISITDIIEKRRESAEADDLLALYESELTELEGLEAQLREEIGEGGSANPDSSEWSIGSERDREAAIPMDEAIARLLPDMSEDPELARSLRAKTQDSLAAEKAENLATFFDSLDHDNDVVWVENERTTAWLAAVNDIRIVLSSRLDIVDEASSEAVYTRASYLTGEEAAAEGREIEDEDDLLAVLYAMLTWWQESLLIAVGIKARRR
ncbi:DUF2017 family protein [Ancrocorticia populi]|uniref:DUF2017 family protein n=1 Tax=Ancrocorticia populi TaxID=2175228 RepID=UPI003F8E4AF1